MCKTTTSALTSLGLALLMWVKMQFEMLLNVYLTWQLLLMEQVIGLLGHLSHAVRFCSGCGVEDEAGGARGVGQVLDTRTGCEDLHGQIGGDRGVGQGGTGSGSCRECNN